MLSLPANKSLVSMGRMDHLSRNDRWGGGFDVGWRIRRILGCVSI
jgi:hypothetical protein